MEMIVILRLGHRKERDKRISTHVGLVSRAFGASGIIYSGEKDEKMMESVKKVAEEFGGFFSVKYHKSWKNVIENAKMHDFKIVHLTAYGIPIQKKIRQIRKDKKILVVVGSEKVPSEVYRMSDYNISITNQPHSEISALAIFLHEYFRGKELNIKFRNAKKVIVPQEKGKKLEKLGD